MWKHFCRKEKAVLSVGDGEDCNWCAKSEAKSPNYAGQFWIYPAKKFVDWPESQAYYYHLAKNSS
jgi:hypothetical protein